LDLPVPRIAISNRLAETSITGRIFDRLVAHFGKYAVLRLEGISIPIAVSFREYLKTIFSETDITLVVVGKDWFGKYESGRRRIDNPNDLVRVEVEVALQSGMPVVPVLVEGAAMPHADDLPDSLKDLVYRNGQDVDPGRDFDRHFERLIGSMEPILAAAEAARQAEEERRRAAADFQPNFSARMARQAEESRVWDEAVRRAEESRLFDEAERRAKEERRPAEVEPGQQQVEQERQRGKAESREPGGRRHINAEMNGSALRRERTLAVVLGVSDWPRYPEFTSAASFRRSALDIADYLSSPEGPNLPKANIRVQIDVFEDAPEILRGLRRFIRDRREYLKNYGTPATDLLIYYVGHGGFGESDTFFLSVRATDEDDPLGTSITAESLGRLIREDAAGLRTYLVLDCCFAGSVMRVFMSGGGPLGVAGVKLQDALPPQGDPAGETGALPEYGTALFCASGPREPAKAPPDLPYTMFTGSLLEVLREGDAEAPLWLSIDDLQRLVRARLAARFADKAVLPQVYAPQQRRGRVDLVPLFGNPARGAREAGDGSGNPLISLSPATALPGLSTDSAPQRGSPRVAVRRDDPGISNQAASVFKRAGAISTLRKSILGVFFVGIIIMLGYDVYFIIRPHNPPIVNPHTEPTSSDIPPPPRAPDRPVAGKWDVNMSCPGGAALNELGAQFGLGLFARGFQGPPGQTELAMGYISTDTLRVTGYVAFFNGAGNYDVDGTATRNGSSSFAGTGRFGSSTDCKLTIKNVD
jgi:hypothetical protein